MNYKKRLAIILSAAYVLFPVSYAQDPALAGASGTTATSQPSTSDAAPPANAVPVVANITTSRVGKASLKLTSSAFKNGDVIPQKYTCFGDSISPPLSWSGIVDVKVKSLVLVLVDREASSSTTGQYVNWVIYNIKPDIKGLEEGKLPKGIVIGTNSQGGKGYAAPCPSQGMHRYYFVLYSLDAETPLQAGLTMRGLTNALNAHSIAQATLMGTVTPPESDKTT